MTYDPRSEYVWGIPLVCAILVLISFLTPMAYRSNYYGSLYVWMWAFSMVDYYGYDIDIYFIEDLEILIPSAICSAGILISIIVLFNSAIRYKRSTMNNRSMGIALLGASIATIFFTVAWMVSLDVVTSYNFWDSVTPHFGLFGLFMGSGIAFVGYFYLRYISSGRNFITIPKKIPFISTSSKEETSKKLTSCPECGNKLVFKKQKYCVNCGYLL